MTRLVYHLKYSCYLCSGFVRVYEDYPGNAAILRPQGLALLVSVSLLSFYRRWLIRGCLPLSPQGFHLLFPAQQRATRCHRGAPRCDTRRHLHRRVRRRAHLQPLPTPAHADRPDTERLALRAYTDREPRGQSLPVVLYIFACLRYSCYLCRQNSVC